MRNLRVGHSYGMLDTRALWAFADWRTTIDGPIELSDSPEELRIDWTGELPYPPGEDITGCVREPRQDPKE